MATPRKRKLQVAPPDPPEEDELPPQEFDARRYQQDIFDARHGLSVAPTGGLDTKGRFVGCNGWDESRGRCDRFLCVWHRRAGKDRTGLELVREEAELRVGSYWHLYPMQVQAKRAIWNGVDPQTQTRLLELVFPLAMRKQTNDQDLFIRFKNESTYQLCGSDNYDRLVGSNVLGVLFSEWALCDPRAWAYILPILLENGGWAAFITTYRGRNHAYQMAQKLRLDPRWYVDVRTIDMTRRANENRVVTAADVEAERSSLIAMHGRARADAMIREEFYCDPMAALPGAVYGSSVATMLAEGRA
jgi:phage terminase large subunit